MAVSVWRDPHNPHGMMPGCTDMRGIQARMLLLAWQHGTVFRIILLFQPRQQLLGCAECEQLCAPAVDVALLRDSLLACWHLIARCVDVS